MFDSMTITDTRKQITSPDYWGSRTVLTAFVKQVSIITGWQKNFLGVVIKKGAFIWESFTSFSSVEEYYREVWTNSFR